MNKYKTLMSNTVLISIGTFSSKLLVFLMTRFYTGYLAPSDYGTADLITHTANLLFPIISLGITDGVFRFALDKSSDRKSVFSAGFFTITLGAVLFLLIAPILGLVKEFHGFVWLIIVYTMASCYHSLCAQYIRAIGKTGLFAVQGIVNTALVIVLNIIFLAGFDMGILGYVLSVVVADCLCTTFLVIKEKLWKQITFKINKELVPAILKYSIPMIPTTIFWWITSASDRYMVSGFIGTDANGIYSVSYKLPTLLTLVSTIFMQAWQFSAVTEDEGDAKEHAKFFSDVWKSFQAIMFLAGSFVIAFAKPAIMLLTSKEYYSAWQYVPLLSVSMVYTAFVSFLGTAYIVRKKSNVSFLTSIPGPVINIILNLLLIPSPLGVQGAAIATVISYFAVFVIRMFNVKKYVPFRLYSGHIIINTCIIFTQAAIMILELKGWIIWQAFCIIALIGSNFRYLLDCLNQILSPIFRRIKR